MPMVRVIIAAAVIVVIAIPDADVARRHRNRFTVARHDASGGESQECRESHEGRHHELLHERLSERNSDVR